MIDPKETAITRVHKMYDIVDDDDSQDILYSEVIQGASLLMAWAEYIRKRNSKKE